MIMKNALPGRFSVFTIILAMVISQFFVLKHSHSMGGAEEPIAIVIDDETGEPIEGAVAIAIWRKHSIKEAAWFEGGKMIPVRIEEVLSDKEGKIFIEDFFDWHFFDNEYPRLTVYKPGYVCWDQKIIYINEFKSEVRQDFDKEHRIVRMKKWPDGFSFNGHSGFVDHVTYDDYTEAPQKLFQKAFDYEKLYSIEENSRINKEKQEIKKREG